jgi:hypothetical protein
MKKHIVSAAILFSCCSMVGMQDDEKRAMIRKKSFDLLMELKKDAEKWKSLEEKVRFTPGWHNKEFCRRCYDGIGLHHYSRVKGPICYNCIHAYLTVEAMFGFGPDEK